MPKQPSVTGYRIAQVAMNMAGYYRKLADSERLDKARQSQSIVNAINQVSQTRIARERVGLERERISLLAGILPKRLELDLRERREAQAKLRSIEDESQQVRQLAEATDIASTAERAYQGAVQQQNAAHLSAFTESSTGLPTYSPRAAKRAPKASVAQLKRMEREATIPRLEGFLAIPTGEPFPQSAGMTASTRAWVGQISTPTTRMAIRNVLKGLGVETPEVMRIEALGPANRERHRLERFLRLPDKSQIRELSELEVELEADPMRTVENVIRGVASISEYAGLEEDAAFAEKFRTLKTKVNVLRERYDETRKDIGEHVFKVQESAFADLVAAEARGEAADSDAIFRQVVERSKEESADLMQRINTWNDDAKERVDALKGAAATAHKRVTGKPLVRLRGSSLPGLEEVMKAEIAGPQNLPAAQAGAADLKAALIESGGKMSLATAGASQLMADSKELNVSPVILEDFLLAEDEVREATILDLQSRDDQKSTIMGDQLQNIRARRTLYGLIGIQ